MKLFGLLLIGGLFLVGGGYWWWSMRPTEPLVLENTRSLVLEHKETLPSSEPVPQEKSFPSPAVTAPVSPSQPTSSPASSDASSEKKTISIVSRLVNFGFRTPQSSRVIDTIVIHSSYNASGGDVYNLDKIIGQYEQYGVGAHYLIDRTGKIYQLVRESNIAYHAGESKMPDGRKNVNDFSVGIELVGTEDSGFTEKQYSALNDLIADIKTRYKIEDIVGHSDIAPTRKTDPWKFDWKRLQ